MENNVLAKTYNPKEVEERWYKYWEENDLFKANARSDKSPFSIVIPPPKCHWKPPYGPCPQQYPSRIFSADTNE